MNFANPHILWFLLVLPPALLAFLWWSARRRQKLLAAFIQARLLPELTVGISPARETIRAALLTTALALSIFALARPQWGFTWEESKQKGLDIIVAIDTSKSMLAEDIAPNRLARAKLAAIDLMQQAKSDRLGLVAFAGGAFLQCPMTIDDAAFRQSVESLDTETLPQGGTAIAEAIETALAAFKEGENHKVLVLFTDGEDHDSNAVEAARKAGEAGMRIFTIGLGSAEGERVPLRDAKGRTDYVRDENNNVIFSKLNESMLQQIAKVGNGFYLPMRGAKVIEKLYENGLAPLPKSESEAKLFKRYHERFHLPLGLAIVLLIVETLLPARWKKRDETSESSGSGTGVSPVRTGTQGRDARATTTVALLALFVSSFAVSASPSSAYRDYRNGQFDKAQDEYQRLLQKKADDSRLALNAGAAAYRGGKFDDAETFFSQAAKAPDLKVQQQAYYNRGNARFHAGDSLEDAEKKKAAWEESLKDFDSATKLNAQDTDAKNNYEFVKKKLEELKQQQQKQDKDDKKQDPKDKKDQDKKDQQKQDDKQQKDDQKKDDQKKSDEQKKQDEQSKQDEKKKQEEKDQKPDEKKQGQQPKPDKDSKEPPEQQQANAEPQKPNPMTPEQAMRVLDKTKEDEKMLPVQLAKPPPSGKKLKDW